MVKFQFSTKEGTKTREATPEELNSLANEGDIRAKKQIAKQELSTLTTTEEKLSVVSKFLDLE